MTPYQASIWTRTSVFSIRARCSQAHLAVCDVLRHELVAYMAPRHRILAGRSTWIVKGPTVYVYR